MIIGEIDRDAALKVERSANRKVEQEARQQQETSRMSQVHSGSDTCLSRTAVAASGTPATVNETSLCNSTNQNRLLLPTLSREADRYGVSDRAAATIATAVLQDASTSFVSSQIIDPSKILRSRKRLRFDTCLADNTSDIVGLYFDGRKYVTLVKDDLTKHVQKRTEEHYVLVEQPGDGYIGHVSPNSGSARNIFEAIRESGIALNSITVVCCDGTNVDTGRNGGVIRLIEQHIGMPVQCVVYMMHFNELPLRRLFAEIDGPTSGPNAFKGPIGKRLTALPTLTLCDVVEYAIMESPNLPVLSESEICDLSTDQKYLYLITQAIATGNCSGRIASMEPGNMSHSRWLTTANIICRLYVSTATPFSELTELVMFVMQVYAPLWFSIKRKNLLQDAPMHLYCMLAWSRYLNARLQAIVDRVIERNAFAAHPKNVLFAMLHDERAHIRELGCRRIQKARSSENPQAVRQFAVPPINLDATDYYDIICWFNGSTDIASPPVLRDIVTGVIAQLPRSFSFPCHTQPVERMIRVVTEASLQVVGQVSRDGLIKSRLQARSQRSKFNTKKDYTL